MGHARKNEFQSHPFFFHENKKRRIFLKNEKYYFRDSLQFRICAPAAARMVSLQVLDGKREPDRRKRKMQSFVDAFSRLRTRRRFELPGRERHGSLGLGHLFLPLLLRRRGLNTKFDYVTLL